MEIEEVVAIVKNALELLRPVEFVGGPVDLGAVVVPEQPIQIVLEVPALGRKRLLVAAHQRERALPQRSRPHEEVEEQLFNGVDAAELVAVDAAEQDDARPAHILRDAYHAWNFRIFMDDHERHSRRAEIQ